MTVKQVIEVCVTSPRKFWFSKYYYDQFMQLEEEDYEKLLDRIEGIKVTFQNMYPKQKVTVYYRSNTLEAFS